MSADDVLFAISEAGLTPVGGDHVEVFAPVVAAKLGYLSAIMPLPFRT